MQHVVVSANGLKLFVGCDVLLLDVGPPCDDPCRVDVANKSHMIPVPSVQSASGRTLILLAL
jgi:hypothetical protein